MSNLRKAAQQALEALETCVMAMQDYQSGLGITEMFDKGERMGREQIAVLRAALAKCNYPDCVDNGPDGKCTRWLLAECEKSGVLICPQFGQALIADSPA